jgi:hypothetical protein
MIREQKGSLPLLSTACCSAGGVMVESNLYGLGWHAEVSYLELVQKLSLESLTWEPMQFRLNLQAVVSPVSS